MCLRYINAIETCNTTLLHILAYIHIDRFISQKGEKVNKRDTYRVFFRCNDAY